MEPPASLHPTDQTLSAFGLGKLDEESAGSVNRHLEECDHCQHRVAGMSGDSFLGRLQKVHGSSAVPGGLPASAAVASQKVAPPPADTLPPGLADHPDYKILRELGRGGMGVVYLAENTLMGRLEVLKVVGGHLVNRPAVRDRFLREIQSAAKLQHKNIVTAYSAIRLGDAIVLAMEYVEGEDLSQLVKSGGPLPVANACYFVYQAALGLQHAHERGMVHRDIKPANLILAREGKKATVKVLDFGLAKVTSEKPTDSGLTTEGQMLGTPDYVAPEQILDAQSADIRADIYSLGATFYYLLTGHPPFKAKTLYDLYQAHISRDADPLNLVRPEVPSELASLVAKMLAKDPGRRFQTPGEVAQALMRFFKPGANTGTGSSPEISHVGQAPLAPIRDQSAVPQPATSRPAPAPRPAAPPQANPKKVDWDSLLEIKETERSEEAVTPLRRVVSGSSRTPPWMVRTALSTAGFAALLFGIIIYFRSDKNGTTLVVKTTDPPPGVSANSEKRSDTDPPSPGNPNVSGLRTRPALLSAPFDAQAMTKARQEWSDFLKLPVEVTNPSGMKLVLIPPGEFLMGMTPETISELRKMDAERANVLSWYEGQFRGSPQHRVTLTRPWLMGTTEVTIGQFRKFIEATGFVTLAERSGFGNAAGKAIDAKVTARMKQMTWRTPGYAVTNDFPVTQVARVDAVRFCNWLSEQEKLTPCYQFEAGKGWALLTTGDGYRLPSEAEWEYACQAGSLDEPLSDDGVAWLKEQAWFRRNRKDGPQSVARKRPNTFGLFDMRGNVFEWCEDWDDHEYYRESPQDDPLGPTRGSARVQRGGAWSYGAIECHSGFRTACAASERSDHRGFRVVRVTTKAPGSETVSDAVPPPARRATVDRKQFTIDKGQWIVQGDELSQTDAQASWPCLMFGDDQWTDYDFTVDLMRVSGSDSGLLVVRGLNKDSHLSFGVAGHGGKQHYIEANEGGGTFYIRGFDYAIENSKWYTARVRVRRSLVDVTLHNSSNEVVHLTASNDHHPKGRVGLRTWRSAYRFKNIKVTAPDGSILWEGPPAIETPVRPPPAAGFVSLFNGKDLTGWSSGKWPADAWHVEDGVLIGSGPKFSVLYSDRDDYRDFHLRAEVRINGNGNSGILFRVPSGAVWDREYEVGLGGEHGALNARGRFLPPRPRSSIPADRWFTVEVIAEGKHVMTKVDGKIVADYLDKGNPAPVGRIALELAGEPRTRAQFRRIEVKDLKSKDD